jgi:hypothetical protein
MNRPRVYYPKSHIIEHLQTKGKEWMYENGTEYIGFFHRYIDGFVMTNASYNPITSKYLIPYVDATLYPETKLYDSLIKNKPLFIQPVSTSLNPNIKDYSAGQITRYFIQRRNSLESIMEINFNQYNLWLKQDSGIDRSLYNAIQLQWKLTGPLHDVKDPLETGVYDTNNRVVQLKNRSLPGLKNYLTDFIEFSVHSPFVSKDIKKLFGVVA